MRDENILELTFEEDSESESNSQSEDSFEFDEETRGGNEGCFHCKPHLYGMNDKLLEMSHSSDSSGRNFLNKQGGTDGNGDVQQWYLNSLRKNCK